MSSAEASNVFGQWLLPEDAQRITKSCNSAESRPPRTTFSQANFNPYQQHAEEENFSDLEEDDLKAAIAASLLDSAVASSKADMTSDPVDVETVISPSPAPAETGTSEDKKPE